MRPGTLRTKTKSSRAVLSCVSCSLMVMLLREWTWRHTHAINTLTQDLYMAKES